MAVDRRVRRNLMRELLATQPFAVAVYINMTDSTVIELAAIAGYDVVILEAEHGRLSLETITNHVRVARGRGLGTLIRVPADKGYIQQILDTGIDGIQVAHVRSADDARLAASAVRYPPDGHRGFFAKGIVSEFGAHGYGSTTELLAGLNAQTVCEIIIEDVAGVENIDEIVAVPGVDLVAIGNGDLAADMGLVDEPPTHPDLHAMIEKVRTACVAANKPVHMTRAAAPEPAEVLRARGVWLVSTSTDELTLLVGMRADLAAGPTCGGK